MSNVRCIHLNDGDAALRLDLISKVHGIEHVESYFNNIPKNLKGLELYSALFYCYVEARSVDKAEVALQKMRDSGLDVRPIPYNALLNLYQKTRNYKRLDNLMHEMEANNITFNKYTYSICMNAYTANSDIEGMEKILEKFESDSRITPDWNHWIIYSNFANLYTKAGLLDKALGMLKKSEGLVTRRARKEAYNSLLPQYAAVGNKDEVLRLWKVYKQKGNILTKGYMRMIASLLKFDDIEGAEKIFEEWETQNLSYDVRALSLLIGAYLKKGHTEKAENLVNKIILNGRKPDEWTWYYIIKVHLRYNDTLNAVKGMKEAMKVCELKQKPSNTVFAACFDFLKRLGKIEEAEELIRLLGDQNIISAAVQQSLLNDVKDQTTEMDGFDEPHAADTLVKNEDEDSSHSDPVVDFELDFNQKTI